MSTIAVAYVPVIHAGYRQFFRECLARGARVLYLLGPDFLGGFPAVERDLRALSPEEICPMVVSMELFSDVKVLRTDDFLMMQNVPRVVLPDEDISHAFAEKYLKGYALLFSSIFLRWDMTSALSKKPPAHDRAISRDQLDRELMHGAFCVAEKSSDWWRHVGAVAVKDGRIIGNAFNRHLPSEQSPYVEGDPRSNFDAGEAIEVSTALHAEKAIVARAAKEGVALLGASLYVTTFPCPDCARVVAEAGIKKVYYVEGYSLLEASRIFEHYDIEVVLVEM